MRKILIISEDDFGGQKLIQLYHSLYARQKKEMYYCSIDIVDCRQEPILYPHKLSIPPNIKGAPHSYETYLDQNKGAIKTIKAKNCIEIIQFIQEYKIQTILIPYFLYDEHRSSQYRVIVKDILRKNKVEIIGLYI